MNKIFIYAKFTYPIMERQLSSVGESDGSLPEVASSNLALSLLYFMKGDFLWNTKSVTNIY